MANEGVEEEFDSVVGKGTELKQELQRLVKAILDEDDGNDGIKETDEAIKILSSLKELKFKKIAHGVVVPDEFKCYISGEIMTDPVVLSSGQTYDRPFIEQWLNEGHRTCPKTGETLAHTVLFPNSLARGMISQWCKEHDIEQPKPIQDLDEYVVAGADKKHLTKLLAKMSSSLSDQKQAAKSLRTLTKKFPSFRTYLGEYTDAIPLLLNPLSPVGVDTDPDLQEDLITTVLNLSIHESNKKLVAETPLAIPVLIDSLKTGTMETRRNAAAALFTLSPLDSNKQIIGESGALEPLINLLDEGNLLAMKDAASAIFNLCRVVENKGRAVRGGAVRVILKKIMDRILVDELLAILAMFSTHPKATEEMGELGAVHCLLSLIRESTDERNKENCVAILYNICMSDRTKLKEIREAENANGTLCNLAATGTSRAKRKANSILERLNKAASSTNTA